MHQRPIYKLFIRRRDDFLIKYVRGCMQSKRTGNNMIRQELHIFLINTRTEKCRLQLPERIGRERAKRLSQQNLQYPLTGKRDVGRQCKRWFYN